MGKIKRQKHVKKTMIFYKQHFHYEPPYTVLIDGTFCKEALNFKINIMEQLPKYLDAEVTLATTFCVKAECETFGATPDLPLYAPLKILSQYAIVPCSHQGSHPICPSHCLYSMSRKKKFIIATQDKALSDKVRELKGVPLLYIAYQAIHLENPSQRTLHHAQHNKSQKIKLSDYQKSFISELKKATFGEEKIIKRKKKKKGPNPLSCLKKKKKPQINSLTNQSSEAFVKKRHKKRKKKSTEPNNSQV